MDWATLRSAIGTMDSHGEVLRGTIEISEGEKIWHFQPSEPWVTGEYKILLSENLEDLAGNNLVRPFDRDVGEDVGEVTLEIEFFVKNRN